MHVHDKLTKPQIFDHIDYFYKYLPDYLNLWAHLMQPCDTVYEMMNFSHINYDCIIEQLHT